MYYDLSKQKVPAVFKRCGKDCYLDSIRDKLIYITPEETVRQKVISYLCDELHIPKRMIRVEEPISHYGVESKRRVDILIHKYDASQKAIVPLCVIECKAPSIMLGEEARNQMLDYSDALACDYAMMTNGSEMFCYHYNEKTNMYELIEQLPKYLEQIAGEYVPSPEPNIPPRLSHEEIPVNWKAYAYEFGEYTKKELSIPLVNFWECLIYKDHTLPVGEYKLFRHIEDLGLRLLAYGNASGGLFQGVYRSFLIEYKGNTEIVSFGLSPYNTDANPDIIKTAICVAIDNEKETHHSLQLVADDNMSVVGNKVTFYHHGRIGVSNKGSGKIDELRMFVEAEYPEIIDGKKFNLGTLVDDRLWNLDDLAVVKIIENFISYALIRDEYRAYVKSK